jgi:hypothetical protein
LKYKVFTVGYLLVLAEREERRAFKFIVGGGLRVCAARKGCKKQQGT